VSEVAQDLGEKRVVLHDEHAAAPQGALHEIGGIVRSCPRRRLLGHGQGDGEAAAAVLAVALRPHNPPVQLDQTADHGETEAGAAVAAPEG